NQEKFAESYSEVFINNHQNLSSTGNFESEEKKEAFFEWIKNEIHLRIPGKDQEEDKIMYAKNTLNLRAIADEQAAEIHEVKRGLAVLSTEKKTANGETWYYVTAFDQVQIYNGW